MIKPTKPNQNSSVKIKTRITSWARREKCDNAYSVIMWVCSPLTDASNEEELRNWAYYNQRLYKNTLVSFFFLMRTPTDKLLWNTHGD